MKIFCFSLRVVIGSFFMTVGAEKILSPYQNFQYVIEGYQVFPPEWLPWIARGLPWVEFFCGLFLLVGLWLEKILQMTMVLTLCFLVMLGQAMIRKLPLNECGCFGEALHVPLPVMFGVDGLMLLSLIFLYRRINETLTWSLDAYSER